MTLAVAAFALPLGACGGDDPPKQGVKKPKPTPTPAISEADVNALPLDTPRTDVERRFGKPFDPKGIVAPRTLKDEPKGLECTYHRVQGGAPEDFFQFCYKQGLLASKLSLVTSPDGGDAPIVPPPTG